MKGFAIGLVTGMLLGVSGMRMRAGAASDPRPEADPQDAVCTALQRRASSARKEWRAHPGDWEAGYRYVDYQDQLESTRRSVRLQLQDPSQPPQPPSDELVRAEERLADRAQNSDQARRIGWLRTRAERVSEDMDRAMRIPGPGKS